MNNQRYKVLALHGFAQNGPTFSKKAAALRKALEKFGVDCIFPTAPHKILAADASTPSERDKLIEAESNSGDWQYWAWAFADDEKKQMRGLDTTIEFVAQLIKEQGPFVGIIGFSQGAAVAAVIASLLERERNRNLFDTILTNPPLRFFISFSGFRMRFEQYDPLYPIATPSLHVIGTLDTVVVEERTVRLLESCLEAKVIRHPGGHFIPNAITYRQEIVQFIENRLMDRGVDGEAKRLPE